MRYISDKNISFSIKINDDEKRVRFTPRMNGGSIYLTNNPAEIKELEKSDMFGRIYHRAPGCEEEVVSEEKKGKKGKKTSSELTKVEEVTNWQEAAEYLASNFDVAAEQLTAPESILAQATAKCIYFPNIK